MKKNGTLALLLMLSMLFPSCANEQTADRPPIPEESNTVSEDQTEPESIAETQIETELTDHVPELDFNGETITFSMNNLNVYEIGADELTGEITNDAVYNRNASLEERFTQSFKTGRLAHIIRISLRERTSFTTFYAKNEKLYRKQVDELYEQLKALGE